MPASFTVVCPLSAEASIVPEWKPRVIGAGASCVVGLRPLASSECRRILVLGLAGGLTRSATRGTAFRIRSVRNHLGELAFRQPDVGCFGVGPDLAEADVACVDHVAESPLAKAELAQGSGCQLVDMESAHVAGWCQIQGWEWSMIRVVLDGADESLPPGIGNWCRADGGMNYGGMLLSLLFNPGSIVSIPALARSRAVAGRSLRRALGLQVGLNGRT